MGIVGMQINYIGPENNATYCQICGNDLNGRRLTCSHECYLIYLETKARGDFGKLDAVKEHIVERRAKAKISATISLGVTLSKICAGCGARCSARGELCAQCQREQVNWKAKQNKAILKSRKRHKPAEESTVQALYNCKLEPENHFRITKFDSDLNPTSTYVLTENTCECPQAHAKSCRHRKMLPFFKQEGHIGDGYFFVWETHQWYRPTGIFAQGTEEQQVIIQEPLITPDPPKKSVYRRY